MPVLARPSNISARLRKRSIRVAQVVSAAEGADWFVAIAAGLRGRGHDVVAIVDVAGDSLTDALDSAAVPWTAIPLAPKPSLGVRASPVGLVFQVWEAGVATIRLAVLLRRLRADAVHAHAFRAIVIGRVAGWLAGVPIRISMVPGPYHLSAPVQRTLDRLTWRLDDRVVASCEHTRRLYRELGVPGSRLACIYYGVDPGRFDPSRADPARVRDELGTGDALLVGLVAYFYAPEYGPMIPPELRGRALKGHEFFLDAARLVLAEIPEARFVVVGAGYGKHGEDYRRRLQVDCRANGLDRSVLFTGFRPDIPNVLAALDVSVQCSLNENLGGTIESLLMEVPTVATRVGGMPEAVVHEETGLLVPPADARALADGILRLLRHREQARRWARAGRRLMLERFTLARTVGDIDALYDEIAMSKTGRTDTSRIRRSQLGAA